MRVSPAEAAAARQSDRADIDHIRGGGRFSFIMQQSTHDSGGRLAPANPVWRRRRAHTGSGRTAAAHDYFWAGSMSSLPKSKPMTTPRPVPARASETSPLVYTAAWLALTAPAAASAAT